MHVSSLVLPTFSAHFQAELRAEFQLVALCTLRPTAEQAVQWHEAIASVVARISDWPSVLALSGRHHVHMLVGQALCELSVATGVPGEVLEEFVGLVRRRRLESLLRITEAQRIAECFDRAGIVGVQLKGAPLSQRLYGDALLRDSLDIDVLVSPEVLSEAVQVLLGLGYSLDEELPQPQGLNGRLLRRAYHHCKLRSRDNVQLELHWRLGAWSETQSSRLVEESLADATTGLRVLPRGLELAYLVAHGTGHYWMRLKWLSDIKQALLTAPATVWPAFAKQSLAAGTQYAVEVTRYVLSRIFSTPSAELPAMAPPPTRHLRSARYALHRMQAPVAVERGMRSALHRAHYRLDCATPHDKIGAALRCVDALRRLSARDS